MLEASLECYLCVSLLGNTPSAPERLRDFQNGLCCVELFHAVRRTIRES
jgi:hypothetical protein